MGNVCSAASTPEPVAASGAVPASTAPKEAAAPPGDPMWKMEVDAAPIVPAEKCITVDLNEPPVDASAPIDERDIDLVQQTWKLVSKLGFETVGRVVFMNIFKIAPGALELFPFKGDGPNLYATGGKLTNHAVKVVQTLDAAVGLLRDLPTLVPVLQSLALRHVGYGVLEPHYDVVGQAVIMSLATALGENMTPSVQSAWLKVYTTVKTVMVAASNYDGKATPAGEEAGAEEKKPEDEEKPKPKAKAKPKAKHGAKKNKAEGAEGEKKGAEPAAERRDSKEVATPERRVSKEAA